MNTAAKPDRRRVGYTWHGRTLRDRFEAKIEKTAGCWIWRGAVGSTGYGSFVVANKSQIASRVVYEIFIGPIPRGQFVLHRCDSPLCVRPEHLFLGTHQDNMRDRNAKGRAHGASGERNPKAKLSGVDAAEIRASKLPTHALIKSYGVDASTIQRIRSGKLWRTP